MLSLKEAKRISTVQTEREVVIAKLRQLEKELSPTLENLMQNLKDLTLSIAKTQDASLITQYRDFLQVYSQSNHAYAQYVQLVKRALGMFAFEESSNAEPSSPLSNPYA